MNIDNVIFVKVILFLCMISGYKFCMELMKEYIKNCTRDVYLLLKNLVYRFLDVVDVVIRKDDFKFVVEIIREYKDIVNYFLFKFWKGFFKYLDTFLVDRIFEFFSLVDNCNFLYFIEDDLL